MKKFILDLICDAEGHPSCTTVLAITGFAFLFCDDVLAAAGENVAAL